MREGGFKKAIWFVRLQSQSQTNANVQARVRRNSEIVTQLGTILSFSIHFHLSKVYIENIVKY